MKILFVKNSYNQRSWSRISFGMGMIATIVHDSGYEVKVIDNNSANKFYTDKEIIKIIRSFNPDILAYSINIYNSFLTYRQIEKIKPMFPKLIIMGGGIHMKYCFEEALKNGIDIVINREGEKVILPLLNHIEEKGKNYRKELNSVKGVSFIKDDGEFYFAKEFPILKNLDENPIVNYELFNIKNFIKEEAPEGLFDLTGQRGCPFKCTFCSDESQRRDNRIASAEWMYKNIKDLYEKYKIKNLFIADNNITLAKERLIELCNKLIDSGLNEKISFTCMTTTRFPIEESLLSLMKKAGFNTIQFGVERLTPYALKKINKEQSLEIIENIFSLCNKQGIKPVTYMLIGFPFETEELLEKEKEKFIQLSKYTKELHLSVLTPIPGTIYYDKHPEIKEWYLDEKDNLLSRTYFSEVLETFMFYRIEKNFFRLPKEVRDAIIDYYFTFKKINEKLITNKKMAILKNMDFLIAKLSKFIFSVSPSIEFFLFNRLKTLRYNVGNILRQRKRNSKFFIKI